MLERGEEGVEVPKRCLLCHLQTLYRGDLTRELHLKAQWRSWHREV